MTANRRLVRTLLVDDAEELRLLVRTVLERSGRYEVVGEAGDGLAAIEQVERLHAELDLVVLDLSMPRMDGLEALPHLRRLAPDARVVVLSAFRESTTAATALEAGAHGYVEKGGAPDAFLAALDRAAGQETGPPLPTQVVPASSSPLDTSEVVARLAHDVRTPLLTARGAVELVKARVPIEDPGLRTLMERAIVALDRVDATLQATVEHARIGGAPLAASEVDLAAVAREAVDTVGGCGDRVDLHDPSLVLLTDEAAVRRILVILIDNACRYTDGRITVRVVPRVDHGVVEVVDEGPGLGPDPARLFAPFTRGEAGASLPGSGLGLSTAAELAQRLGGELSATSPPDGGACFALELPR
ncbi:response regulator [Nitriliruptoraceae bacterium ZYF776]|nr:response regulator [Profundirhabdus halotolerans]